jgi:hypothetical protein
MSLSKYAEGKCGDKIFTAEHCSWSLAISRTVARISVLMDESVVIVARNLVTTISLE